MIIGQSLCKTRVVVVAEEAAASHSIGSVIAKNVRQRYFDHLDSPVACLTSADVPAPVSSVPGQATLINDGFILERTIAAAKHQS